MIGISETIQKKIKIYSLDTSHKLVTLSFGEEYEANGTLMLAHFPEYHYVSVTNSSVDYNLYRDNAPEKIMKIFENIILYLK